MSNRVGNQFPKAEPGQARLAIVGEAPGREETTWSVCDRGHEFAREYWEELRLEKRHRCPRCGSTSFMAKPSPFVGPSGTLLNELLQDANLPRAKVFVGNCAQVPLLAENKTLDSPEVRAGLDQLGGDLERFKPNCVLLLGNLALQAFQRDAAARITQWRGSIFEGGLKGPRWKCVAGLHPAAILRMPKDTTLLRFDVKRAVGDAEEPDLFLPKYQFWFDPPFSSLIYELEAMAFNKDESLGFDIEGTIEDGVTTCSLATDTGTALSVPFTRLDGTRLWSADQEAAIWTVLKAVLENSEVVKVMHNAAYEMFVLAWLHGIKITNMEDTMLGWWSIYPELDKGLDVLASILTRQPFWGRAGRWNTQRERDEYNCIDSLVTLECWEAMRLMTTSLEQQKFYEFSKELLEPVVAMELRGIRFDRAARANLTNQILMEYYDLQGQLDQLGDVAKPTLDSVADVVAMKRKRDRTKSWDDVVANSKPRFRKEAKQQETV